MSAKPRIWYYGTTLMEAQKIVEGDYTVFNTGGGTFYKKVRGLNQAVIAAERAIGSDADKPAIVELLIKDQSHDSGNRIKIKSTRIVSAAEILRRTGHTFDRIDTGKLLKGVITRASNQIYTVASRNRLLSMQTAWKMEICSGWRSASGCWGSCKN